jgi:nucleotide-binding universal stress UspA family protein
MEHTFRPAPSVVVGIDGSRAAVAAALWAVDEAVHRDVPLRLVYVIEPMDGDDDPQQAARSLATAELAVRYALTAVESTGAPVKIEVEILQGQTTGTLLHASHSAAMICVGAVGLTHATVGRLGSTAATLAASANCLTAIVRGHDPSRPGVVVAEMNQSHSGAMTLDYGFAEAQLRGAPLRVLTTWESGTSHGHDDRAVSEGNRQARARLDRCLSWWYRAHPDLDIRPVAAHGTTFDYLARNADDIQLVVVSRDRAGGLRDVVGPRMDSALHGTNCSILVCPAHGSL